MMAPPYPTLQKNSEDYVNGKTFDAKIDINYSGADILVKVAFSITEDSIRDSINEGNAVFAVLVESSTTFLRRVEKTDQAEFDFPIDKKDVGAQLDLTPQIIAINDINDFSSENLNPDYFEQTTSIPRFGIMAMDDQRKFMITKDDLKITESICEFKSDNVENVDYFDCGKKIVIRLPEKVYAEYKSAMVDIKLAYTSIFAVPILVNVVNQHLIKPDDSANQDSMWYNCLKSKFDSCPSSVSKDSAYEVVKWMLGKMSINAALGISANQDGGKDE